MTLKRYLSPRILNILVISSKQSGHLCNEKTQYLAINDVYHGLDDLIACPLETDKLYDLL